MLPTWLSGRLEDLSGSNMTISYVLQNIHSLTSPESPWAPSASLMSREVAVMSTPFIDEETETQRTELSAQRGPLIPCLLGSSTSLSSEGL